MSSDSDWDADSGSKSAKISIRKSQNKVFDQFFTLFALKRYFLPKLTKWQKQMWYDQNQNSMVNQILMYLEAKMI